MNTGGAAITPRGGGWLVICLLKTLDSHLYQRNSLDACLLTIECMRSLPGSCFISFNAGFYRAQGIN